MELRQLEYFVAVAEEASFTRAAERVHISQSGVSAQIRQLERELGAVLVDRSARAVSLTPAGEAALEHARAALAAARAVGEAVGEVTDVIRGRLAVGMVAGCTVPALFEALAAFHRDHPGVSVTVTEDSSDRLLDRVRHGRLDVALVGVPVAPPADLASLVVVREGLVALVPEGHALAGTREVSAEDLAEHPLVCMPEGTGIRAVLDLAFADRGLRPPVAIEASSPLAIADLARRGLGVGVLSASMAAAHDALVARPVRGTDGGAVLAVVWAPAPTPALRAMIGCCERAFAVAEARPAQPRGRLVAAS